MTAMTREAIFADVTHILADFHGHEYSGPIGPGTRFFADLGLASIDTVVLGETLQHHYGRPLPFADLIAEMGQRAERDLAIGELVTFLHRHLASAPQPQNG
jgi:acyl carrier protein